MKKIRIGAGAGYAGDRIEPAIDLINKGNIDYICFECLAERTIALAQQQMLQDPDKGYNELLEYRMMKILPACAGKKIKVITNMGAANPFAAARVVQQMAKDMGLKGFKIAAVTGDDVYGNIERYMGYEILETGNTLESIRSKIISANAYIGTDGIIEALKNNADIIIAGRVADPALFLAPIIYEFGWDKSNFDLIGKGILTGHLLECSSQVMGGYFADPGYKDVPDLWNIGFPIAEVSENGEIVITKLDEAGGMVTSATCKEQILYEIHDPANYMTPDGIADYSEVEVEEIEKDRVLIKNAKGKKPSGLLKVSVGYKDCFFGEGEISYGGPGAYERARLAEEIIRRRLDFMKLPVEELRVDYIGINSLFKDKLSRRPNHEMSELSEVRLRVAARTTLKEDAEKIGEEVEALYLNGPAGGGGARKYVNDIVSVASIFIQRDDIEIKVLYVGE